MGRVSKIITSKDG